MLPNGLTLLVERRRDAPAISVVTHVKAGYFDEPDEWVGISHVLEHMFFKGTPTRPNGVLARDTENLGGMLNAATIYDKTMYYTVVPSAAGNLAKAVSLQSDALQNLSLDRDELQREIEVIVQEVNRKRDNPDAMASETLHELLFQKHRIRRWRIGTESGLRALRAEDVRSYYETRYSPERTIVAIVGDIDADEAVSLAEKEYGSWQRSFVAPDTGPVETDLPQPRVRILKGDVQNPSVFLGWRTVDDLHSDRAALDLVAAVAGRGRGSWLNEAVRAEGLASVVRSFHYTTSEVGLFEIMFKTDADRVEEVVEKCLALVNRIRHTPPVEDDLLRVRSLAMTQWAGSLESTEGRAMLWCDCEALGGYELADKWYEEMMSVSVGELSRVAEEYLDSNRASLVAYCPREADLSGIERDWPRTPDPLPSRKPASMNVVSISRRQAVPSSAGSISFNRREKFDSLTRVKSGTGVVSLGIYFEGCRSAETEDVSGISSLLVRSALRGAGGMEERELAVAGEMLGGTIHP
ncbi:MAG: insulinase family protein, partial [Gemmatimonadota bacterium]|nr:insulinase family protein [Gemmatimonadota bacterium]